MNVTERRILCSKEGGEADGELRRVGRNCKCAVDFFEVGLLDRFEETIVIWVRRVYGMIPMPRSPTVVSERPVKADNCVSEIRTVPASLIPRFMDCNNGRMTKLMPPTEVKLGAVRVVSPVKLSNSNVPVIVCKLSASKVVKLEI